MNTQLIAVVGHPSTGKDTVARYIYEKWKCDHVSLSDLLRVYIKENNLGEPDRDLMHNVGDGLRKEHGGEYLMRLALERTRRPAVLSAVRTTKEGQLFKKEGGIIIAVSCPIEERYRRSQTRKDAKDRITFEKFKAQEESEAADTDPTKMNVNSVMAMADYTIENNGTLEELFKKVEEVLEKIK